MTTTIHRGDFVQWMRGHEWLAQNGYIPKAHAHAVLCDPPYFLGSIVKRFGGANAAPAKYGTDGLFQRSSAGFMNQKWDGFSDVWEYQQWVTDWGRLMLSFVYPGAVLAAFGGTRTYHRLAAGLEDAGWIVFDCMMWTYASGFPKSHNISKAIDREAGAEREVVGINQNIVGRESGAIWADSINRPWKDRVREGIYDNTAITAPATDAARQWDGYGTALAPAYEPIILARAPWSGTYAGIAQQYGTGALAIDAARIPTEEDLTRFGLGLASGNHEGWRRPWMDKVDRKVSGSTNGRWPKNLVLSCACPTDEHTPDCPVRILNESAGESIPRPVKPEKIGKSGDGNGKGLFGMGSVVQSGYYDESSDAARMFYQAKAGGFERFYPVDGSWKRIPHPTLKPVKLTEYLATLLLMPKLDEPRRLLVPFSGVGSEMIGALLAGWDDVVGFEQSDEYADIAEARIAWWSQFSDYDTAKRAYDADHAEQQQREAEAAHGNRQLTLFEALKEAG